MSKEIDVRWVEVSLKEVLDHFVTGFEYEAGETLTKHDAIVDAPNGRVVFKLTTSKETIHDESDNRARDCPSCNVPPTHVVKGHDEADGPKHQFVCDKCDLENSPVATIDEAVRDWNNLG
ncbi:hypothetical protein PQR05_29795 [Paraburkholderia sediminicola]|uniref:hypothetical protein n=1 Tax=Paraburkholderia sediminicola TaxID=458836 RepID=UPI0038BDC860